jgi:subtilisin family serine protease
MFGKVKWILLAVLLPMMGAAQNTPEKPPANWQNLDLVTDGVFGISTEKAYTLLKGKKATPVVVAVIDGGVDTNHEDLKAVMWRNPKEIAGNGKDDDHNGHIDDINGWNFIGSAKGNVQYDNLEVTRLVRKYKPKYESVLPSTPLSPEERKEFAFYRKVNTDYVNAYDRAKNGQMSYGMIKKYMDQIVAAIGKQAPGIADFEAYSTKDEMEERVMKIIRAELKKNPDFKEFAEQIDEGAKYFNHQIEYHLNLDYDPRDIVGDQYETDKTGKNYGNNDVAGPDALHGSHVAGIIGAVRDNNLGIKGVSNAVQIMSVRAVPDGDERDKDVANAIRYAAENGARVINMSFGKGYSTDKGVVDSAVRFALSKDVLLVHAAGNDSENNDLKKNFPNRNYGDTSGVTMGTFGAWIEVGASGWKDDDSLVAEFSNYGQKSVDVFAPGVKINSTVPGSAYKDENGTSMASPVVAGLAALIRAYYPALSAQQVKDIILKTVTKVNHKVKLADGSKVDFSQVCYSGGIVNAYAALQLAAQTKAVASTE